MNISHLSSLAKLISTNPNEAKALIKLLSIDVLKSLGDGKYSISTESKTILARSDKPLSEGAKYWGELSSSKDSMPKLSNLMQKPQILKSFENSPLRYDISQLKDILSSNNPASTMKQNLLEIVQNATSKEEFSSASNLLLSLQSNTLTIPIYYENYFSIMQMKKRYNKRTKKSYIDFYASLERLGAISGLIELDGSEVTVNLNVAYEKTERILRDSIDSLPYRVNIEVIKNIEPLYDSKGDSLLDIKI